MLKFQNKTVLVTGGGTGIGMTVAKKFAENGANIIILGRRPEPLESTKKMLEGVIDEKKSNGSVQIFPDTDVSDAEAITSVFSEIEKQGTGVDIVINNAGVSGPVTCFSHAPVDEFESAIDIHLTGTFWTSVQALRVMKEGGKIITISTFFTEERPLEQRPYRFRSPYTASQGAKNRLVEAMSWELTKKGIVSIGTNPGPVHSDRIYKTVYPKAASEFLRVSGFEDLTPTEVETANKEILGLLGEDEETVKSGIKSAAQKLGKEETILASLLNKVQYIAEKIQKNTSTMIPDQQFLSQEQVAATVLTLADDEQAKILNGKIIPGDRVFYPVKSYVASSAPKTEKNNLKGKKCVIAQGMPLFEEPDNVIPAYGNIISGLKKAGAIVVDVGILDSEEMEDNLHNFIDDGIELFIYVTGDNGGFTKACKQRGSRNKITTTEGMTIITADQNEPQPSSEWSGNLTELAYNQWNQMVHKYIHSPAIIARTAMNTFVPGGSTDPRKFKDAKGRIVIVGPTLPSGKKVGGHERAKAEVFRGALRPFTTTVNQELSDVLKSNVRMFLILPGTVDGKEPNPGNIMDTINYLVTDEAASSSEVIFCPDETR